MDRYTFSFSIYKAKTSPLDNKQWYDLVQQFERDTGLSESSGRYHVDIPSPQFIRVLDIVEKWIMAGLAHFYACTLRPESTPNPDQWRRVYPTSMLPWVRLEHNGRKAVACDAGRVMPDSHFRLIANLNNFDYKHGDDWFPSYICVSETFINCVREHKLKGLKFTYIPDTGKYGAQQWFVAVPIHGIGRGIDHPWVDPVAYYQFKKVIPFPVVRKGLFAIVRFLLRGSVVPPPPSIPPNCRAGIFEFPSVCMVPGRGFGDISLDRLFLLVDPVRLGSMKAGGSGIWVQSYCRVLREHLPDTDFAYYGSDHMLYVSPRAYRILKDRNLLQGNRWDAIADDPVEIVDELPAGAEPLDRLGPVPAPTHWRLENVEFMREVGDEYFPRQSRSKPRWQPHLNQIAATLKQLRRDEPGSFNEGASDEEIKEAEEELGMRFPEIWRRILQFSSPIEFFEMDFSSDIPNATGLKEFRDQLVRYGNGHAPDAWLPFGYSAAGDYWVFDFTTCDESHQDCRVLLVTHEGYTIEGEWPSIPHFLDEAIEKQLSADPDE